MYKLCPVNKTTNQIDSVWKLNAEGLSIMGIPFDAANTDYTRFKKDLQDGVELQDAEDQVMTKEQVEEFMRSLP